MNTSKPLVTVAIPTFGRDDVLVDTIKQVLQQDFDAFELIVADQTAEQAPKLQKFLASNHDHRLRYFRITPPSLPAGRNFILTQAKAAIILFVDDDVVLEPGFIQAHYNVFEHDPAIVAVGGRVINKTDTQPLTKQPLGFDRLARGNGNSFNCDVSQAATSFPGGNMSMRVTALEDIGGFDTSYQNSAVREESDVAMRLIRAGGKVWFAADASLLHLAAGSGGTRVVGNPFDSQSFYNNDLLFMFKAVHWYDLPLSLIKHYADVVRGQTLANGLRRSGLFVAGLVVALGRRIAPSQIVAREVTS